MYVAVTGASGFVGRALSARLSKDGHRVLRLVRRMPSGPGEVDWDPLAGRIDPAALAGVDVVVHLAGENIGAGRWTEASKTAIRDSRILGTRTLVAGLKQMEHPPKVLVSASAVGFYGNRGEEELKEGMFGGGSFLADLVTAWEKEALVAQTPATRVVCTRFGVILGRGGGALAKMLPIFKLGLGGKLGSGRQWMAWVSLTDAIGAILFAIESGRLLGPVNVVGPQPATNLEFTKALGRALHRPTLAAVPEFALRAAFGEMAEEMLLASLKVIPAVLLKQGYVFKHPTVEQALRSEVG
jgi:hypothetical protein